MISWIAGALGISKFLAVLLTGGSILLGLGGMVGGVYYAGYSAGQNACLTKEMKAYIERIDQHILKNEQILAEDRKRAEEAERVNEILNERIRRIPENKRECLDEEQVERIFSIK